MKQPIDRLYQEHMDKHSLQAEQLQQLQKLMVSPEEPASQTWAKLSKPFAIAASILVLVTGVFLGALTALQKPEPILQAIAEEVVYNHLKQMPMEVTTSSITGIRDYFEKLNFVPNQSSYISSLDLNLEGGRYCSIQGITAAQLRLQSPLLVKQTDKTLYQVADRPKLYSSLPNYDRGEPPSAIWVNGVQVTIWKEKGIVFALAETL